MRKTKHEQNKMKVCEKMQYLCTILSKSWQIFALINVLKIDTKL